MLRQQILDLNDKFDYFVAMMAKSKQLPVEELKPEPKSQIAESLVIDTEVEKKEIIERFNTFKENATSANLGNRQEIRQECTQENFKKMGSAWLANLENLVEKEEKEEEFRQSVMIE